MSREAPCTHCRTFTRFDVLADASDRLPFGGLLCPQCDDDLTVEEHDDPLCTCEACSNFYRRKQPALHVVGGFNPELRPLLGDLLDDERPDNDNQQANAAE